MGLTFVDPKAAESAAHVSSVFLYGGPKTGKTVGALSSPGPILFVNAEGFQAVRYARRKYGNDHVREVTFEGPETFEDVYDHLSSGKAEERTVVFDSLPEMYQKMLEVRAGGPGKFVQLDWYRDAQQELRRWSKLFRDLPVNTVWIASEDAVETGTDIATGAKVIETKPYGAGRTTPKLPHHFDIVAYASIAPPAEGETEPRYMAQLCNAKGRTGGDRFGVLGLFRPLDLSEWAAVIERDFYGKGRRPAPAITTKETS